MKSTKTLSLVKHLILRHVSSSTMIYSTQLYIPCELSLYAVYSQLYISLNAAFVIPIGDDYAMPYSSPRDTDEHHELCKNMAARLRIKDDETITVGPCFTNDNTGQMIVCFTLTSTHERPHNMCFYFRVTASGVNPSTDACGGRNVTNAIAGLVSIVRSPRMRPAVVNHTIRNTTSLKYRPSENVTQKEGHDRTSTGRATRRRRDVNNDTSWDDPLAHMLADTLKSMVVEKTKELQQESLLASANITPTAIAPIVGQMLIVTPQNDSLSWIAYKNLYKVSHQALFLLNESKQLVDPTITYPFGS